jgi:lipid-binding SYLF domain-containing protein
MSTPSLVAYASSLLCLALLCCQTAPDTASERADLQARSAATVERAKRTDPSISAQTQEAIAYAVFPRVSKGAAGVGGAYGKGVLYEGGAIAGYCDLTQGTVGVQLGGQTYSEIIVFKTREALQQFKQNAFTFDAQATAVALRSGAAANANYSRGVAVFTMDEAGLMFEASVGGQKFTYVDA